MERIVEIKILIAFEEEYHIYQGTIAAAIRILRPHAEVDTTTLDTLRDEVERFDPDLVICSRSNTVDPGGRIAWVELSIDPTRPTKIHVGDQYSEMLNPTLDKLLAVIDELDHAAVTNANN